MALARTSLRTFLATAKSSLRSGLARGHKLTFVIGNESADLDSLTASIFLAYIRSNAPPANAFTSLYIPVMNLPAADIKLRPEFIKTLSHANVDPDTLITLDDLPLGDQLASKLPPASTRWLLVDHNALQGALGAVYFEQVAGVIDHHEDEGKVPAETGVEPRVIEKCGSCNSLVANYCKEAWDRLSERSTITGAAIDQNDAVSAVDDAVVSSLWDAQLAKLALASVLIDTTNMKNADKVMEHDVKAVKYLESKIAASTQASREYNRDTFFDEISQAKNNIDHLKLDEILRKDYKAWTEGSLNLGVACSVKNLDFLIDKAGSESSSSSMDKSLAFTKAADKFASARRLDIFAIMTTSTSSAGRFQRELFLSAKGPGAVEAARIFVRTSSSELGLEDWLGSVGGLDQDAEDTWRKAWLQREVQHSRKRIAPLLRQAMGRVGSRM